MTERELDRMRNAWACKRHREPEGDGGFVLAVVLLIVSMMLMFGGH